MRQVTQAPPRPRHGTNRAGSAGGRPRQLWTLPTWSSRSREGCQPPRHLRPAPRPSSQTQRRVPHLSQNPAALYPGRGDRRAPALRLGAKNQGHRAGRSLPGATHSGRWRRGELDPHSVQRLKGSALSPWAYPLPGTPHLRAKPGPNLWLDATRGRRPRVPQEGKERRAKSSAIGKRAF